MEPNTRKPVQVRLPLRLLERVDAESRRLGQTRTMFIERALLDALEDEGPVDPRLASMTLPELQEESNDLKAERIAAAREVLEKPKSRQVPSLRETWGR